MRQPSDTLPLPLRRRLEVTVTRTDGGVTVLRATGELDLAGSSRLAARLNEVIWRPGGAVVVDLDVEMIDSTGLAVLLNALRRLDRAGRQLHIVSAQPCVRRLLRLTRVGRDLPLVEHVDDALAAIAA
jgi:anti-sigma B factor antagonist